MTAPKIVASQRAYQGFLTLDRLEVEADGVSHRREVVSTTDAVAVLPVDPERRRVLLVRQWRIAMLASGAPAHLIEACAGKIDPGEAPEASARRETLEELGLRVGDLEPVATVAVSPGFLTERIHLYLAIVSDADRVAAGGGLADEGEGIEVVDMALDDFFALASAGGIEDAKTLILALAAERRFGRRSEQGGV